MANVMGLFRNGRSQQKNILKILNQMESSKIPVRLQVENSSIHFFTILSLRRGMVVFARPTGNSRGITKGKFVRFTVPDQPDKVLRLEVEVPSFKMVNGTYVMLCAIPEEFAEKSKRISQRYNITRFKNIMLGLPTISSMYRMIDISAQGCKVFTGDNDLTTILEVNEPILNGKIYIGSGLDMSLKWIIPRVFQEKTAGFEFQIAGDHATQRKFEHFIYSLESAEKKKLKVM